MSSFFNRRNSLLAISAVIVCASVYAATPVEMQKARHEHYEELGDAFKAVRDQSKASPPDFVAMLKAAETVQKASLDQQQWFTKGTGPEAGKTRALPEIWSKPDDFTAAQKLFAERAPALVAAVKAKDVDAVSAAFKQLGGACKNCHDTFRSPEE
ncbi:MAG: cytochrome c [Pseudomonadota bacterium]